VSGRIEPAVVLNARHVAGWNEAIEAAAQRCRQHRLRMNEINNRPAGDAAAYLENDVRALKIEQSSGDER
jgi:hypothetical protein